LSVSLAAAPSLNDLIRSPQQRRRDGEAEGLGGLEVDDKIERGSRGLFEAGLLVLIRI